jgi:plasmid stabilization system protein ParE
MKPASRAARPRAILEALQSLVLFPNIGRQQQVEGVRKLVTQRYAYLVYYTVDDEAGEIIVLAIQHPAREREHSDAWWTAAISRSETTASVKPST